MLDRWLLVVWWLLAVLGLLVTPMVVWLRRRIRVSWGTIAVVSNCSDVLVAIALVAIGVIAFVFLFSLFVTVHEGLELLEERHRKAEG